MVESAAERRTSLHGHWSSRFAFILAVSGSAIGLGNIWKFPYIAGVNGGGAFVLVYLLCVFIVGLPIMMAEILIGRRGRRNPIATMALLGEEGGKQPVLEAYRRRWCCRRLSHPLLLQRYRGLGCRLFLRRFVRGLHCNRCGGR